MELDFEFYGFLRRPLRRLWRLIICRAEEKLPIAERVLPPNKSYYIEKY